MVVISVSISPKELKDFEEVAKQTGFSSRSDAVRDALHRFVSGNNWINGMDGRVSCVVSIIYADRKKHHVHDIIHEYADIVHSSMHTHIDHRCVEQIVLDGSSDEVRRLLSELAAQKDVRVTVSMF
jgi:CopG family nickel-responsive transcriptional regulator